MGYGDSLMASGMSRGLRLRAKRAAFGDGKRIIWAATDEELFRDEPLIAKPGDERCTDIEWIDFYRGHRAYGTAGPDRWTWKPFKPVPHDLRFTDFERSFAERQGQGFVVINPDAKVGPSSNKSWGFDRYAEVASELRLAGLDVRQFVHPSGDRLLPGARPIEAATFRQACAAMFRARLYIGNEGGLHHAAAHGRAVVIFGGFISPLVTGYDHHVNLFKGFGLGCGARAPCECCKQAMARISVEEVVSKSLRAMGIA